MNAESRIQYQCPFCDKMLSINQKHAGQWGKCKHCGEVIQVPELGIVTPNKNKILSGAAHPSGNLINCPDCNAIVSHRAPICPQCGSPIASIHSNQQKEVQTIEKTSKALKIQMLLSMLLMLIGITNCSICLAHPNTEEYAPLGVLGFFVGIIWFIMVRVSIWWHHG